MLFTAVDVVRTVLVLALIGALCAAVFVDIRPVLRLRRPVQPAPTVRAVYAVERPLDPSHVQVIRDDSPRVGHSLDVPAESPDLRFMRELAEVNSAFDALVAAGTWEIDADLAAFEQASLELPAYRRLRLIDYEATGEHRVVPGRIAPEVKALAFAG